MINKIARITIGTILCAIIGNRYGVARAYAGDNSSANSKRILSVGDSIPETDLTDINNKRVTLTDFISQKPTLLIFYRGGWCPYCNTHLGKLQQIESELLNYGYQIIAICPDRPEQLRKSIVKHNLTYTLLSDSSMKTAQAFGLAFTVSSGTRFTYRLVGINIEKASGETHHQLPVPAAFIVDTNGIIRFAHSSEDYKVRINTDEILDVVKGGVK